MDNSKEILIGYTNHRDELSIRRITPKGIYYGSTQWHAQPQWLLEAYDHNKEAERTFALSGILWTHHT